MLINRYNEVRDFYYCCSIFRRLINAHSLLENVPIECRLLLFFKRVEIQCLSKQFDMYVCSRNFSVFMFRHPTIYSAFFFFRNQKQFVELFSQHLTSHTELEQYILFRFLFVFQFWRVCLLRIISTLFCECMFLFFFKFFRSYFDFSYFQELTKDFFLTFVSNKVLNFFRFFSCE